MDKKEFIEMLDQVTQSFKQNPNHFRLNINTTLIGMQYNPSIF